ncbi:MAG: DHHA1 domain-containing protein, partial [Gammaproteobacteria bacterium]
QLRGELPQAALFLAGDGGGSASFAASGAGGISAKEWMNAAAKEANAKGGGKPAYAQAGGGDTDKIKAALKAARDFAANAK